MVEEYLCTPSLSVFFVLSVFFFKEVDGFMSDIVRNYGIGMLLKFLTFLPVGQGSKNSIYYVGNFCSAIVELIKYIKSFYVLGEI